MGDQVDLLWERCPPESEVFAVLDGAADPELFPRLLESGLKHRCLFDAKISGALAQASPHIVALKHPNGFTDWLLTQGWGKSYGIYSPSQQPLATLYRDRRKLLRVKTETGQPLLFRFYDPRILRAFLPTCAPEELKVVFGKVQSFWLEPEEDDEGRRPAHWTCLQRGEDGALLSEDLPCEVRSATRSPLSVVVYEGAGDAADPQ